MGIDVGELRVEEKQIGNDLFIQALTDVEVRILFRFRVQYVQHAHYSSGELVRSSLKTYRKEKLNSSVELIRTDVGYLLIDGADTSVINDRITYSGSLLYFHEPSGILDMYIELSGRKVALESTGVHEYRMVNPDNGKETLFYYDNGELSGTRIGHRLATIHTERIKD
jgi:hypothetical protein